MINKTSRYVYVLDAGHGGVINGVPQTAGKRSPEWDKGVLYEGVINRLIMQKVIELCQSECIPVVPIIDTDIDVSLSNRVKKVNGIASKMKAIFISIHCDAFHKESANGWSAFTYYGQTDSDKVSTIMYKEAKKSRLKIRQDQSDGDPDKEANFKVLRETTCPAILVENLFMTNKKDYNFLMSEKGRNTLAKVIFRTIQKVEQNGL